MNIAYRFLLLMVLVACSDPDQTEESPIVLEVWYGDQQQFGTPGLAQKWINILGNVSSSHGIKSMSYRLNNHSSVALTLGSDLHRLARTGDFNIDLDVTDCSEGMNQLHLEVVDSANFELRRSIEIAITKKEEWPLPYTIDWSEVTELQEVVQVVDGHWEITDDGVHNHDTYYDRVLAFGDNGWEDYEVTTTVVFHDFTPPVKGPPTYNVSHAAIASRWPGHDVDQLQPHRKWFPLGATSEFRLTAGLDSCRWRIFDGPKPDQEKFHVEQPPRDYRTIVLGKKYGMKHRVKSLGSDRTQYSVKLWPFDQPEPETWDFQGVEEEENLTSGSALLIAHNTSVTFGDVSVVPIDDL